MGRDGSKAVQPRGEEYFIPDMASNGQLMLRGESRLAFGHFCSYFKISKTMHPFKACPSLGRPLQRNVVVSSRTLHDQSLKAGILEKDPGMTGAS